METAEELIVKNNFQIFRKEGILEFKRKSSRLSVLWTAVFGFLVLIMAIAFSNILFLLFGIGLTVWPIIKLRQSNPTSIVIDYKQERLKISTGVFNNHEFHIDSVASLEVDEKIFTSDVSPFKDGYRDFHYQFAVMIGGRFFRIMSIQLRQQGDESVKLVFDYLSSALLLTKEESKKIP
ncbi:MAG: hypothetical protein ABJ004_10175 [Cyclobacteriaceae bacterium]